MNEPPWVALIDDDEAIRRSLARLLRSARIHAVAFSSAEEFLGRLSGSEPACLVLDVQLGAGLNGFELRQRLECTGRSVPIIFMTGQLGGSFAPAPATDPVQDILLKPFEAEEVLTRVRRHIWASSGTTPS